MPHRALDPASLQVAVWCLPERRSERSDEVRLGHTRDRGQRHDIERVSKVAIHCVPRPQHPPMNILDAAPYRARPAARFLSR
jgi:hypothetical protein